MRRIASDLGNFADLCVLNLSCRLQVGGMQWENIVEVKLGVLQLILPDPTCAAWWLLRKLAARCSHTPLPSALGRRFARLVGWKHQVDA